MPEYTVQPLTKGTLPPFIQIFQAHNDRYNKILLIERMVQVIIRYHLQKLGVKYV